MTAAPPLLAWMCSSCVLWLIPFKYMSVVQVVSSALHWEGCHHHLNTAVSSSVGKWQTKRMISHIIGLIPHTHLGKIAAASENRVEGCPNSLCLHWIQLIGFLHLQLSHFATSPHGTLSFTSKETQWLCEVFMIDLIEDADLARLVYQKWKSYCLFLHWVTVKINQSINHISVYLSIYPSSTPS